MATAASPTLMTSERTSVDENEPIIQTNARSPQASATTAVIGLRTASGALALRQGIFRGERQAAGPAVPERNIGPGTGSGMLWHARGLEMAACPANLADSGGSGHHRTPRQRRCRHGEDRPMGAGEPGLERPRTDRRFPPLGVKAVESDQRATQKALVAHRGGA